MTTRREFFQKLAPFHAPSSLLSVELAYTLAKFGHRAQVRKELDETGRPVRYFEHVKRVALILIDEVKLVNKDMVIAALIHDGIEDTRDLTPAMIEHVFGEDVVKMVKTLSKDPKEGYLERFHMSTDYRPYILKGCDRLDNLRSLGQASLAFQEKQIKETRESYFPLFNRMVDLTPEFFRERAIYLNCLIQDATNNHVFREPV